MSAASDMHLSRIIYIVLNTIFILNDIHLFKERKNGGMMVGCNKLVVQF